MQKIANIRIDERLIHGQVAAMWVNTLQVNRIMVVDHIAYQDPILKTALKMACPAAVKLSILTPEKAAANLLIEKYDGDTILIVARGPEILKEFYEQGFHFTIVNVGNMSSGMDTKMIKKSVHVTPQDIKDFKELHQWGVEFTAQMFPNEAPFAFLEALDK